MAPLLIYWKAARSVVCWLQGWPLPLGFYPFTLFIDIGHNILSRWICKNVFELETGNLFLPARWHRCSVFPWKSAEAKHLTVSNWIQTVFKMTVLSLFDDWQSILWTACGREHDSGLRRGSLLGSLSLLEQRRLFYDCKNCWLMNSDHRFFSEEMAGSFPRR